MSGRLAYWVGVRAEVFWAGREEQTHYLRVCMAHLREKLEAEPSKPRLLITEPGVGYRLIGEGLADAPASQAREC